MAGPAALLPIAWHGVRWAATRAAPAVAGWVGRRAAGRTGTAAAGAALANRFSGATASSGGRGRRRTHTSPPRPAPPGPRRPKPPGGGGPKDSPKTEQGDWWERVLTKNWALAALDDNYQRVLDRVARNLPQFAHAIVVTVEGGPQADLRRTYYLALAAAFGRYRNGVRGSIGNSFMNATIDVTGKAVAIEIGYTCAATWEAGRAAGGQIPPFQADNAIRVIEEGPSQVTIGGDWPTFLTHWFNARPPKGGGEAVGGLYQVISGAAESIKATQTPWLLESKRRVQQDAGINVPCGTAGNLPDTLAFPDANIDVLKELVDGTSNRFIPWNAVRAGSNVSVKFGSYIDSRRGTVSLPDTNRVITTGEKNDARVQPPRPALDGSTRSGLLALVAQSLTDPCFLPESPPCTIVPVLSTGVKVSPRSAKYQYNSGEITIDETAPTVSKNFGGTGFIGILVRAIFGPDGYFRGTNSNPNLRG